MSDPVKAIARRVARRCLPFATAALSNGSSRPWRSLLFDGARHHITFSISGARLDEAIEAVRDEVDTADFAIAGHLVAELRVAGVIRTGDEALITLDALTIEA